MTVLILTACTSDEETSTDATGGVPGSSSIATGGIGASSGTSHATGGVDISSGTSLATGGTTGNNSTTFVGLGGTTEAPSSSCANLSDEPVSIQVVPGARAYHDVVFSASNRLIGSTDNNLMTHTGSGSAQVLVPNIGTVEGMDVLDNGDVVAVTGDDFLSKKLVRVTSNGGQLDISTNVGNAFGVMVGPDGMIYVGSDDGLLKFDPVSKQRTVVFTTSESSDWQIHFTDYSPDRKRLYLCTNSLTKGAIYFFDMDENFKPTTRSPKLFAEYAGENEMGGYCDGIAVDTCGNLYVADFLAESLFKITPSAIVSIYQQWSVTDGGDYGHGMGWGAASGGWDPNALYMPQPYNRDKVAKVVIGVPGRPR